MPTVSSTQLTLTTVNSDTTITVDFDTEFNEVERNLRDLGVTYHPHIDVVGVDGVNRNVLMLDAFPHTGFGAVAPGAGPQTSRAACRSPCRGRTFRKTLPPVTRTRSAVTFASTRWVCRRPSRKTSPAPSGTWWGSLDGASDPASGAPPLPQQHS